MEVGEGDGRVCHGPLSDRLLERRILQQRRQRVSSKQWQDEHPAGIHLNRSTVEALVDPALPFLPVPLREDPHAGIQDPDQQTTHPDQERRVEAAVLPHQALAVLLDDPHRRVPCGPQHPPRCEAQCEVGTRRERPRPLNHWRARRRYPR